MTKHQIHHLPRLKGCPICDEGKHVHKYKRRKSGLAICVSGPDAVECPFGALVHMGWIEIRRDTPAYQTAKRALVMTDDITEFMGASPSNHKTKYTVVEAVHRYDDTPPKIRRWWSDRASEIIAASRHIRSIRPLAHCTSIAWRHAGQASGEVARQNDTL